MQNKSAFLLKKETLAKKMGRRSRVQRLVTPRAPSMARIEIREIFKDFLTRDFML